MEPSSRRIHGMLTLIDPSSEFIKSVRAETIVLIQGYFFFAWYRCIQGPLHARTFPRIEYIRTPNSDRKGKTLQALYNTLLPSASSPNGTKRNPLTSLSDSLK
ncbi:hypothetical protein AVEN_221556-1 [Araneus ventricosus]|uniref:Uncharacterized protein n=1 Tax=Araneus ventricosus TaxID=182803 RepID=A0A4Y2FCY6_ARAVE|nr:hypothetical protein AVEN_221556-1 [Araneus ventricosus]